ncbi:hypothetical protein [Oryza sativa Japonica Group]|uniref:Uncharacterized protein P0501G01.21 n=1 Tax=Oryza sativa subsp. japonica TaxID=39947 RepID=Q9AXA0_ORYSJ|nr:hypothetical protein [Oryza sativa Japonica Group]
MADQAPIFTRAWQIKHSFLVRGAFRRSKNWYHECYPLISPEWDAHSRMDRAQ